MRMLIVNSRVLEKFQILNMHNFVNKSLLEKFSYDYEHDTLYHIYISHLLYSPPCNAVNDEAFIPSGAMSVKCGSTKWKFVLSNHFNKLISFF